MKDQKDIFKEVISEDFHKSTPSKDFTANVMSNIEESLATETIFEPLISKRWWKISGILSISIIVFSFIFESQYALPDLFSRIKLPSFENYKSSIQLTGIIVIMLAIMTTSDLIYRKIKHID